MDGWINKPTNQPNKQTNNRAHLKEGRHDAWPGEEEWVGMWVPTRHGV